MNDAGKSEKQVITTPAQQLERANEILGIVKEDFPRLLADSQKPNYKNTRIQLMVGQLKIVLELIVANKNGKVTKDGGGVYELINNSYENNRQKYLVSKWKGSTSLDSQFETLPNEQKSLYACHGVCEVLYGIRNDVFHKTIPAQGVKISVPAIKCTINADTREIDLSEGPNVKVELYIFPTEKKDLKHEDDHIQFPDGVQILISTLEEYLAGIESK